MGKHIRDTTCLDCGAANLIIRLQDFPIGKVFICEDCQEGFSIEDMKDAAEIGEDFITWIEKAPGMDKGK